MEQDIELLEKYLKGSLSAEDRSLVERRLSEEPQLASRLEIIKGSYIALDPEIEAFEHDLKEIHMEFQSGSKVPHRWRKGYLVAASLVAISLAFLGYLMWFKNPTTESLYLSYLEAPPNNITVRGQPIDQLLESAMTYYEQEDYQSALEQLTEFLRVRPDHQGALFYRGICHLMLGQFQSSLMVFESFEAMDSSEYYTAAKWYLSLNLIKMGQVVEARSQLEQLARLQNGKYSRQAKELLDRMN